MKFDKKSILAIVLSLAMALSLVPVSAFAVDDAAGELPEGDATVVVNEDTTQEQIEELVQEVLGEENEEQVQEIIEETTPANETPAEEAAELDDEQETEQTAEEVAENAGEEEGEQTEALEEEDEQTAGELQEQPEAQAEENLENAETPAEEQPVTEEVAEEFDVEEAYRYLTTLSEDELEEYAQTLTDEQIELLRAYINEIYAEEYEAPETVVFTEAGPFMDAVEVPVEPIPMPKAVLKMTFAAAPKAAAANASESTITPTLTGTASDNALETIKTATKNSDGSYTITLETYATGSVSTKTTTEPVDIVLVLDQSGSMAYSLGNTTRQAAMRQSVNSFIGAVAAKYDEANGADHRISIVTFGDSGSTLVGWTPVTLDGKEGLNKKVNGLPDRPSGATRIDLGMEEANKLINKNYSYTGKNTTRKKVVIVFTDGVPTTGSDFEVEVANRALTTAATLKGAGVTVYSIGVFTGANSDQLYGNSGFDRKSNGDVGTDWSDFSVWKIGDIENYDIPAGNRFLNYLSSNFSNATGIGIKTFKMTFLGIGYRGWEITNNAQRTATGYYLTANDESSLNNIFTSISENIQSTDVTLDSTAVVSDIVTPYFNMPAGASAVSAKIVPCASYNDTTKVATWKTTGITTIDSGKISIDKENNRIDVTGYSFKDEFVSQNVKSNGSHGSKLVISFNITPKSTFWGGNDVPTNGELSGVYTGKNNSGNPTGLVEEFTVPKVNVRLLAPTVSGSTKNIYYSATAPTSNQLFTDTVPDSSNMTCFVTFTTVNEGEISNTADSTVRRKIVVNPTTSGANSSGTPVTSLDSNVATAYVNVFTPVASFKDSSIYWSQTPSYSENFGSLVWKHGDTLSTDVKMFDSTVPTVSYNYSKAASAFTECTTVTGYPVVADHQFSGDDFTVHVYVPQQNFKDSAIYYSNTPDYSANIDGATTWVHGGTDTGSATPAGTAPAVSFTYSPDASAFTTCTEVTPSIKVGGNDCSQGKTNKFKVHVFKPEASFKDSVMYLSQTAYYSKNLVSVTWSDSDGCTLTPQGTEPEVTFNYDKAAAAFDDCTTVTATTANVGTNKLSCDITDKSFTVHVKTPTITWTDHRLYYGDTIKNNGADRFAPTGEITWADGTSAHNVADLVAGGTGAVPTAANFSYSFTYATPVNDSYMPDTDVAVKVSASLGANGQTKTSGIKFAWTAATGCDASETDPNTNTDPYQFRIHPDFCTLTVKKSGLEAIDENQACIFTVSGGNILTSVKVAVTGNGSVKIGHLPVGSYTVTEDGNWSWRYDLNETNSTRTASLQANNTAATCTLTNTRNEIYWLNGCSYAVNVWTSQSDVKKKYFSAE